MKLIKALENTTASAKEVLDKWEDDLEKMDILTDLCEETDPMKPVGEMLRESLLKGED